MRAALVFGQLDQRRVPTVASQPRGFALMGNSEMIADFRTRDALFPIFVELWATTSPDGSCCARVLACRKNGARKSRRIKPPAIF